MSSPVTSADEQPEIATPRLRLRGLRARDAGVIALYANDQRVARMTMNIPHPYLPGMADAFIEHARSPRTRTRVWALDAGLDGENGLVGLITLEPRDAGEHAVGYWVAPAFWGAGYATEAVDAIVAHARELGTDRLVAEVIQDNAASIKVLTRSGFSYLGEGETHSVGRGAMVPTFRYSLDVTPTGSGERP